MKAADHKAEAARLLSWLRANEAEMTFESSALTIAEAQTHALLATIPDPVTTTVTYAAPTARAEPDVSLEIEVRAGFDFPVYVPREVTDAALGAVRRLGLTPHYSLRLDTDADVIVRDVAGTLPPHWQVTTPRADPDKPIEASVWIEVEVAEAHPTKRDTSMRIAEAVVHAVSPIVPAQTRVVVVPMNVPATVGRSGRGGMR